MNRVTLVGRLTKDPELRYTQSGAAVATFAIAVDRIYTNQQGERETDFISIVCWRKQAENVANYLRKGRLAGIDGKIQTRNYEDHDGKRVYVTEVVAESVQFLEPGKRNEQGQSNNSRNSNQQYNGENNGSQRNGNQTDRTNHDFYGNNNEPFVGSQPIDISDDDLPF